MGEEVSVEGGVVIQEAAQVQGRSGGGEIGQADLSGCDDGPLALSGDPVVGVGGALSHCLEDHEGILVNEPAQGAWERRGRVRGSLHVAVRPRPSVRGGSPGVRKCRGKALSVSLTGTRLVESLTRHLIVIGVITTKYSGALRGVGI